jgi:Carboxypeptidase regulatory-like domain
MTRFTAAAIIAASLSVHPVAQGPSVPGSAPKDSARISGRVVAAATGRPLSLATVRLSGGGNPGISRTVRTDSSGQYEISDLAAGRYSLVASRTAFLEQHFDQPRPFARYRLLELAEGEHLDGLNFSLHRGAAITGVVTDEAGDPLEGAYVVAMREQFGPNGRVFYPAGLSPTPIQSDDEGRYRVYGLRPGTYRVMATSAMTDDSPLSFGKTYFPGTLNELEAQTVRVDFGLDGVANFAMIPAKRARVSGIVRDSQGRPAAGMRLTLNTPRVSGFGQGDMETLGDDGSFTFEHVLPGQYLLHVRPSAAQRKIAPANVEWGAMHVNVTGEDISGLTLTTSTGFAISGRVTLDRSATLPAKLTIGAREMDLALQSLGLPVVTNNAVDAAGRFRIVGVRGRVRVGGGGGGWFTKRVLLKGNDVTTGLDVSADVDDIEVVLTNQVTTVTGTVRDARGIGRNDFVVTFFPVGQFDREERASRQRTIRPDPDGVYRIRNLPPGDYLAAAVPVMSLPMDGEWDPAFLEKVRPAAISFKLAEGQSLALNLTLIE